jgi:hypothetical protein
MALGLVRRYDPTASMHVLPPLAGWETFYVILGSSAAALTGLQFVVIALGAESKVIGGSDVMGAFGTPTVVHFCAVLLISAIVSTPGQTAASLSLCLSIAGIAGLAYAVWVLILARRQTGYAPVLEDWIWHNGLPLVAYACLFVAGVMTYQHATTALYFVGATALLLLYDGIHNAWDAALWMSSHRKW